MQLSQSQIKNGWKVVKLGEVVDLQQGLAINIKSKHLLVTKSSLPLLRITDLINKKEVQFVDEKLIPSQFIAENNSLIYSRTGQVGLVFKNRKGVVHNNCFKIIPFDVLKKDFLYQVLKQDTFYKSVNQIAQKSAQPDLTHTAFKSLDILLPPLSTQEKIAGVLGAYDDLIENNDKRIKVLEVMAQKLYTEWFVNFKFPGAEKVKMVSSNHSDFGIVPEGWEVRSVGSIASFLNGFAFKPSHLGEVGLPIVKIPELRSGILEKTPRNTGENIPEKYILKNEDILFSWSATLLVNIWNSGPALLNQHLFKVTPNEKYLYSFVYIMLQNQIEKYRGHAVGATMQHLRKDVVEEALVICPNLETLKTFEEIVGSFLKEISTLQKQNQNLKKSRDFLIPQLVGGRVEVKN